ncbi:MFS transporter [Methylobacterium sp. WL1]|uniref:MFS transporter n=2 Tax=unclassified Methylobacterium TaxID=2615210 RepID=UPI0011C1DF9D|nr:MFS transporter [Methylobacterium sp. WL1]QEE40688.1 MFS transporter [Methylobacterium sp. WL1]TXN55860.1 MFS transporter [Methylobacterium sp. WL2]
MMTQVQAGQLLESLDRSDFTAKHWRMYVTAALGHLFDGFDINMMGFALPGIVAAFTLSPAEAGVLASSVFIGMLIGSTCVGFLADRFGRKWTMVGSIAAYCVLSCAVAFAWSHDSLLVLRILQGIGLGAEVPLVFTYLSEFIPARRRGLMLASTVAFWQGSSFVAAMVALLVIPAFTWRGMFIAGAVPGLVLIVLWALLPESVRFLIARGRLDEADRIVDGLSTVDPRTLPPTVHRPPAEPARLSTILRGGYFRPTASIWLMQLTGGAVFFAVAIWLPSIFARMGFPVVKSFAFTGLIAGTGALGNIAGGLLLDRWGRRTTVPVFLCVGGLLMFAWGQATESWSILGLGALTAFFASGGAGGPLFAYTSEVYPTRYRAVGTGWAAAWQRIGGIVAAPALGWMLGNGAPNYAFFTALGMLLLIGGVGGYLLGYETRGKSLEAVTAELSGMTGQV